MKKLFLLEFLPINRDLGLLLLRVTLGVSLFVKHGWEKLSNFNGMVGSFPDPIHIGQTASLACALAGDAFCSVLVLVGLGSRLFSAVAAINLFVAFAFVHHFSWFGPHSGEVAYLYMCAYVALFVAGPGRYSLDQLILEGRLAPRAGHPFTRPSHA